MSFRYFGFCDPSGGSGKDRMVLAICHVEDGIVILDKIEAWTPPFNPSDAVAGFCRVLRDYRCSTVTGDDWAKGVIEAMFSKEGVVYEIEPRTKTQIFREFLVLIHSGKVRLLDLEGLAKELINLERRTRFGGKDSIAAPPGVGHYDDIANAVGGACTLPGRAATEPFMIGHNDPIRPETANKIDALEEEIRSRKQKERERKAGGGDIFRDSINMKKRGY